jgi:adenine-specific DNA-methyltransferase
MVNNTFKIENRRYTGSKAKLIDWIFTLIKQECKGEVFADIFAGTGVVAAEATKSFKSIILNDFLFSNEIIYKAFFKNEDWDKDKLKIVINNYNALNPNEIEDNYFSSNFGDKYFDLEVSKLVGFIRNDIEVNKKQLNDKEYSILLASLIYSIDRIANTVGHFDAYIRKTPIDKKLNLKLIEPILGVKSQIYRQDANLLAKKIIADVVYIDPPYNSRQYSRFYHVFETLIKWDNPKLYGVALKPEPENTSEYSKTSAPKVFNDLIEDLNCKYIVVSYSNNYNPKSHSSKNKITLEQIENSLNQKGKTKKYTRSHKFFNSGKTNFDNHQELLFITKVNG